MKTRAITLFCFVLCVINTRAQSKVFKEVSDEVSSQMKVITQDDALIGYLLFTRLEKANADSFNYKITIMDENLNDIGNVEFREQNLDLRDVAFEQDMLCLAYLKSNVISTSYKSNKSFRNAVETARNSIFTQFVNLQGKILKTNAYNVDLDTRGYILNLAMTPPNSIVGTLKHNVILRNIPQKGFVCFYGDESKNNILTFDTSGKQIWHKDVPNAKGYALLTTSDNIYILSKKDAEMVEGGYEVNGYVAANGTSTDKLLLKDKKGHFLKVLGFENDPSTGKPFITGNIIDENYGNKIYTSKQLTKGTYDGVFTISLNGPKKSDIKETFSYWNDGSQMPMISEKARFQESQSYTRFSRTMRDYNGNTYFIGSSLIKKTKIAAIATAVVLSPLIIVSPFVLAATGTVKCKVKDALLLKQDANGKLSMESTIPGDETRFYSGRIPLDLFDLKKYYNVTNSTTKSNFLIVDDIRNIVIYNVNSKKVVRTVPHKDGSIRTNIFPAKEGYIMVSEYNKKEKYTRLSIESL